MGDRYSALTVVLDSDVHDEDIGYILNAIRMIRGVQSVEPHVSNIDQHIAMVRVKDGLREKLLRALEE